MCVLRFDVWSSATWMCDGPGSGNVKFRRVWKGWVVGYAFSSDRTSTPRVHCGDFVMDFTDLHSSQACGGDGSQLISSGNAAAASSSPAAIRRRLALDSDDPIRRQKR